MEKEGSPISACTLSLDIPAESFSIYAETSSGRRPAGAEDVVLSSSGISVLGLLAKATVTPNTSRTVSTAPKMVVFLNFITDRILSSAAFRPNIWQKAGPDPEAAIASRALAYSARFSAPNFFTAARSQASSMSRRRSRDMSHTAGFHQWTASAAAIT